jgi:hypothetical protein
LVSTIKLYKWSALGSSGTGGYGAGKNQDIFLMLEQICISFLPERDKIQFDSGGGCIIT